jgi:hypothetical protein
MDAATAWTTFAPVALLLAIIVALMLTTLAPLTPAPAPVQQPPAVSTADPSWTQAAPTDTAIMVKSLHGTNGGDSRGVALVSPSYGPSVTRHVRDVMHTGDVEVPLLDVSTSSSGLSYATLQWTPMNARGVEAPALTKTIRVATPGSSWNGTWASVAHGSVRLHVTDTSLAVTTDDDRTVWCPTTGVGTFVCVDQTWSACGVQTGWCAGGACVCRETAGDGVVPFRWVVS